MAADSYCTTRLAFFEMRSIMARMLWHSDMDIDPVSQDWTTQKEYAVWDKLPLWVTLSQSLLVRPYDLERGYSCFSVRRESI